MLDSFYPSLLYVPSLPHSPLGGNPGTNSMQPPLELSSRDVPDAVDRGASLRCDDLTAAAAGAVLGEGADSSAGAFARVHQKDCRGGGDDCSPSAYE